MTAVYTVPAVTAALIAQGKVTVITAAERGTDGRVLIRAGGDPYELVPGWRTWPTITGYATRRHVGNPMEPNLPLHPGCIVASGTVEWVPIVTFSQVCVMADAGVLPDQYVEIDRGGDDGTLARAGILTDVQPTTERCPACWGAGGSSGSIPYVHARWRTPCHRCNGAMTCPPIPCDDVGEWP